MPLNIKYKFCKDLGFSNKFLDNSSNMGTDKACKILHYYPEINAEWLITGKGSMLKSEVKNETITPNNDKYIAMLEKNNALLEENKALLQAENERLKAENERLKGKDISAMEDKIENQRQQIQHLTNLMPSVSDTTKRQNLPRF